MKKVISLVLITMMVVTVLVGCGSKTDKTESSNGSSVAIKESPDKYTWYIKNYVGKNCASVGYTSLAGYRMDSYGDGYLKIIFVTSDGTYVDVSSEDDLKKYAVTSQSVAPNTELKLTYMKDSEGNEYDNLIESQNIEEIELSVKPVGNN